MKLLHNVDALCLRILYWEQYDLDVTYRILVSWNRRSGIFEILIFLIMRFPNLVSVVVNDASARS